MRKTISMFVLAFFIVGCSNKHKIPVTNRVNALLISKTDEKDISNKNYEKLINSAQLYKNKKHLEQIQRVSKKLLKNIKNKQGYKFKIIVLANDKINACALPDGRIFINSGIFKVAHNDAQIASVIAHEIAHVLARHTALRITRANFIMSGKILGSTAMLLINPLLLVPFLITYEKGVKKIIVNPRYKFEENEADIIALHILKKSKYDLNQSLIFWDNMHKIKKNRISNTHDTYLQRKLNIKKEIHKMKNQKTFNI